MGVNNEPNIDVAMLDVEIQEIMDSRTATQVLMTNPVLAITDGY